MLAFDRQQFDRIGRARFAERVVEQLRQHFPERIVAADVPAMALEVEKMIDRAKQYGLTAQGDVYRFVLAAWVLGASFDEKVPTLRAVLSDSGRSPAVRARLVARAAIDALAALESGASGSGAKP
ncbi:MAG: hypothetical protein JSW68_12290 [Burkholderiales bacterium]|nr:MAG: hypothetical protein JSW68_12290 [Burkholderiales bacterium]